MTPIILEDELAAKRYSYFQQRFRLEGFGSTPDLTLREPPPAYVENPADDVGITFGDDKPAEGDEEHYVTGWKLFGLMLAITMACFLVLLDMSVIVTVRRRHSIAVGLRCLESIRQSRKLQRTSTRFLMLGGTGPRTICAGAICVSQVLVGALTNIWPQRGSSTHIGKILHLLQVKGNDFLGIARGAWKAD